MMQMRRITPVVAMLLGLAGTLFAADVVCPLHTYAPCYSTGQVASTGSGAIKWHCSCGDDVWVAPESPTPPPPPPAQPSSTQSTSDAFKQGQAMGQAIGAPIGQLIAQSRARHQQEKNDLVKAVYCRQNPSASLTFANGKIVGCDAVTNYTVAYCTTKPKDPLCKDLRKMDAHDGTPRQTPAPAAAPVTPAVPQTPIAAAPEVQPLPKQTPVVVPPAAPVDTPATSQPAHDLTALPQTQLMSESTPEISVAEAARKNREAKAKAAAEEKTKENPPQQ
jgi:hypothetical protein